MFDRKLRFEVPSVPANGASHDTRSFIFFLGLFYFSVAAGYHFVVWELPTPVWARGLFLTALVPLLACIRIEKKDETDV